MLSLLSRAIILPAILLTQACSQTAHPPASVSAAAGTTHGLILQANEGERRVRRTKEAGVVGLSGPFIIKVDRINGGSKDLVMGYEELGPGQFISPHHHVIADEIIFVHKGTGIVSLGERQAQVSAGGTIYIPRNTRIALRNNGSEPLGIAFIFSKPGFEGLMRENSVLEGQPVTPLSAEEQAKIQARNKWHTVREK
jgi:quercetin dioxygenase-like cupin family protein